MDRSLNSELNVLANHLSRIALADRHTCDFTVKSLRDALTEVIACFPVYRTYVTERQVSASDRKYIVEAIECAKAKSTAADASVYDFIREILLTRQAEGHLQFYQRSVVHFAMKFQQYTGAVMAKGLEDTSFYRYHRLVSLNEVGGDPLLFGVTPEEFHRETQARANIWPHSMVSSSTHDSKRSEDVRARINVLSEIPESWREHVLRWHELNRDKKRAQAPLTLNDEYLFYQTLVGIWPQGPDAGNLPESFIRRINEYMVKAIREAKDKTSWANQNQEYESAVTSFEKAVLDSREFREDFEPFARKVAHFGMLNSLAQTLIKLTVPGVPDTYQGNELWEFNLVDPDNRRAVDYAARQRVLENLQASSRLRDAQLTDYARKLTCSMGDGRIKMYVIWKTLGLRNQQPDVFRDGDYTPLRTHGQTSNNVVAFARKRENSNVIVAVPRLCARQLGGELGQPTGANLWHDTAIEVPTQSRAWFRNIFTGELVTPENSNGTVALKVSSVLGNFPVALLAAVSSGDSPQDS